MKVAGRHDQEDFKENSLVTRPPLKTMRKSAADISGNSETVNKDLNASSAPFQDRNMFAPAPSVWP